MIDSRGIVKFFDRGYLLRFLLVIMLCALAVPLEILAFSYLNRYLDIYILVSMMLGSSLVLLPFAYYILRRGVRVIRTRINNGDYPEQEFCFFFGTVAAAVLMVIPGPATTVVGLFLLFPLPKKLAGMIFSAVHGNRFKDVYEYLKLYSS